MLFGYCRVSKEEQSYNRQIDQLKEYGIHNANIYKEKISGVKSNKERPQLNKLLEVIEKGDILVVTELTRLGRSMKDLISISDLLKKKEVQLVSLKENLDTTTATGQMLFGFMAVLSQFERDLIAERTREGLKAARARGRSGGRPTTKKENIDRALMLYDMQTVSIRDICEMCNMGKSTLYKYIDQRKNAKIEEKVKE